MKRRKREGVEDRVSKGGGGGGGGWKSEVVGRRARETAVDETGGTGWLIKPL